MNATTWNLIQYSFKIVCVIGVACGGSYWLYKYEVEDRDIGVVDYVAFEEATNVEFPVASVCFTNPFINQKLNETDPMINSTSYLQYLKGEIFNESFRKIDYENVSLNLKDHFLYGTIKLSNESKNRNTSLEFKHKVIFNGFYYQETFVKCFEVTMDKKDHHDIRGIRFYYSNETLLEDLGESRKIYYNIHYPEQFLMETNAAWNYVLQHTGGGLKGFLNSIEILRRRNSRSKRCTQDWKFYDNLVLEKHIRSTGCRAPYQSPYKEFPICSTMEDIKNSIYEYHEVRSKYYPKACQRISKIDLHVEASTAKGKYEFVIDYPDDLKLITQNKEVDAHALIGNMGAYIGLFLGNIQT